MSSSNSCQRSTSARVSALFLIIVDGALAALSGLVFWDGFQKGLKIGESSKQNKEDMAKNIVFNTAAMTLFTGTVQMLISVFLFVSGGRKDQPPGWSCGFPVLLMLLCTSSALICVIYHGILNWTDFNDIKVFWVGVVALNVLSHLTVPYIASCFTEY